MNDFTDLFNTIAEVGPHLPAVLKAGAAAAAKGIIGKLSGTTVQKGWEAITGTRQQRSIARALVIAAGNVLASHPELEATQLAEVFRKGALADEIAHELLEPGSPIAVRYASKVL